MMTIRAVVFFAAVLPLAASIPEPIHTQQGDLTGVAGDSSAVRVFKGIPYAEPPIQGLRWKAPKPPTRWNGVFAADHFGSECIQPRAGFTSEDCLTLNVYTAAKAAADKLPVMVWIHGGALQTGAGSMYDGEALAKKGVVVVTINYRLGILGFLAHPDLTKESDTKSSGNYGILDQIAALEWVKKNIAAFGGDPGKVTIFGESAGSWSVNYLTATPLAKGLFERAIGESGAEFAPARSLADMEKMGEAVQEAVKARTLVELREKSPAELTAPNVRFQVGVNVDGWLLPQDVYSIYSAGKQNDVPMLIGSNNDEGTMFTRSGNLQSLKAASAAYGAHADDFLKVYSASTDAEAYDALAHNMRDRVFGWEMRTWARLQSKTGKNSVYMYYFSHVPPPPERVKGAYHGSEIAYAFGNLHVAPFAQPPNGAEPQWTDYDRKLADEMSSYWVNFAATGDPNGASLPKWPVFKIGSNEEVMSLGDTVESKAVPNKAGLDLLDTFMEEQRKLPHSPAAR
ncbi:MAG TPA: carboxylesterase family protein [Bryobacteraceae bacterium]|nr:carboxylesterase family protein [Bryobacteraceae bacterium]